MATAEAAPFRGTGSSGATERSAFWPIWVFAALMTSVFGVLAAHSTTYGELPRLWLVTTVAFTWLTMSWTGGAIPRPTRRLGLTLLAQALIGFTAATMMGAEARYVLSTAIGVPTMAVVTAVVTQLSRTALRITPHAPVERASAWRNAWIEEWAPATSKDLLALAAGAVASGVWSLAIGAVPRVGLSDLTTGETFQWMTHVLVVTVVGGAATLIIFATWTRADLRQPWVRITLLWLASAGLLVWVHQTEAITMAWLQVVPSIFVALNCRIWVTALFSLLLGLVSVLLSPSLNEVSAYPGPIPLGTVMDLLVGSLILVALTLGFIDRNRNQALDALAVERARTERHLEVMHTIFEAMQDGIIVVGPNLELRFHNRAAVELLGREFPTEPAAPGNGWTNHFGVTSLEGEALRDDDLLEHQYVVVPLAEGRRVIRQRVLMLSDLSSDGRMVVMADATDEHDRLHELSGFAGVVAHDLRAPLASSEGWLELAEEALASGAAEQATSLMGRARASNERMREVINGWLDYTVERQGTLVPIAFPLSAPVNNVVSDLAETGPHRFTLDVPHHVVADLTTIRQVLANVIGNASKYSRPDETPRITVVSTDTGDGWIRVDVVDHGIGIPPGQEERIFEEYQRGTHGSGVFEGFGLGLALCRRIVERHGGQISARTNEHGGATISFTLPGA